MLTRLTALDGEAILPLADAKAQVRVLHEAEDDLIATFRDAAVGHVERVSGVALADADYRWTMRTFPTRIDLPMQPVTALGEVTYDDDAGESATYTGARLVGSSVYAAVNETWPYANGYAAVEFTAGLTSPDEAPELIMAAKLLLGHFYMNREAVVIGGSSTGVVALPLGVQALIDTYRQVLV